MMKIVVPKNKTMEIVVWLTANLSKPGLRCWITNGYFNENKLIIDATEEEESILSFIMLKWA